MYHEHTSLCGPPHEPSTEELLWPVSVEIPATIKETLSFKERSPGCKMPLTALTDSDVS